MNANNHLQKVNHSLVPMRKATIDALLLTVFTGWFLFVTGVLFSYPWLIVVLYVLAYLLAVVRRLRQAARQMAVAPGQEQPLEKAYQEMSSPRTLVGLMLFWGNHGS